MLGRGAFLSLVCAAIGAAGWAAISVATEMRLGFLAILVGGLAGFGMAMGNKGRGGAGAGFIAGVVACLAILGSRFAVMHMGVREFIRAGSAVTPEVAVLEVAAQVAEEFEAQGIEYDDSLYEDGYPEVVLDEAQRRWDALAPDEQESYMQALRVHYATEGNQVAGLITVIATVVDFGLFGFVWVALGAGTAYRIGCAKGEGAQGAGAESEESGAFWARTAAGPKGDDDAPADPLAALGAGMRAEMAADKSDQFRSAGPATAAPPRAESSGTGGPRHAPGQEAGGREAA
jgi:hypothetical protein